MKRLKKCHCRRCAEERNDNFRMGMMILCPKCGNKRCPHASNHNFSCTNSNASGQAGSDY